MAKEKDKALLKRREFLTLGSSVGLLGLMFAGIGAALFKFLFPVVSYGNPKKFRLQKDSLPEVGDELTFPDQKIIVQRPDTNRIAAISLVCTHLGCTVNRVATGFQCPCHGSQYDEEGVVVGGPAPKTLAWHAIKVLPGNIIEIDTGTNLKEKSYFTV